MAEPWYVGAALAILATGAAGIKLFWTWLTTLVDRQAASSEKLLSQHLEESRAARADFVNETRSARADFVTESKAARADFLSGLDRLEIACAQERQKLLSLLTPDPKD